MAPNETPYPAEVRSKPDLKLIHGALSVTEEEDAFGRVKDKLRDLVGLGNFSTWCSHLKLMHLVGDCVVLSAPTAFVKEWVTKQYGKELLQSCQLLLLGATRVEVEVRQAPRQDRSVSYGPKVKSMPAPTIMGGHERRFRNFDRFNHVRLGFMPTLSQQLNIAHTPQRVKVEDVQRLVQKAYGLKSLGAMLSLPSGRKAFPLYLAMYLCVKLTRRTAEEIGAKFGGSEASTVQKHAKAVARMGREKRLTRKAMATIAMVAEKLV